MNDTQLASATALGLLIDAGLSDRSSGIGARTVQRGQTLMHEGDESDTAWYVVNGRLRVFRMSADGAMVALAQRSTGDLIGELSLIDGETRCASVIALEDSHVVWIPQATFNSWLKTEVIFASALVYQLARQLRESSEKTYAVAAAPIAARLAAELFRLASRNANNLLCIIDLPSVTDLAVRINATRESVSKTLSLWQASNWVDKQRRSLVIVDAAALSELLV